MKKYKTFRRSILKNENCLSNGFNELIEFTLIPDSVSPCPVELGERLIGAVMLIINIYN